MDNFELELELEINSMLALAERVSVTTPVELGEVPCVDGERYDSGVASSFCVIACEFYNLTSMSRLLTGRFARMLLRFFAPKYWSSPHNLSLRLLVRLSDLSVLCLTRLISWQKLHFSRTPNFTVFTSALNCNITHRIIVRCSSDFYTTISHVELQAL